MAEWRIRRSAYAQSSSQIDSIAEELNISPFLLKILSARGITDPHEINQFLDARLNDLVNPELWPQVPEAADFIVDALCSGKKFAVWGDYDVDGVTSTVLVLEIMQAHGFHALWHIPDRKYEGYGLGVEGIQKLVEQGIEVLLTVDSGISDIEAIRYAQDHGIDVIVSDHHLPPEELPPAKFFFNPRMFPKDKVPCPYLAGVGVAFFLMAAVNTRLRKITGKNFKMDTVLDLVALGTLADVMRLSGQNRILVRAGLRTLSHPQRPGISALKKISRLNPNDTVNASHVSFRLAPRINAAGRMEHARIALNLLRSQQYDDSISLADTLDNLNLRRRDSEKLILDEAREQAKRQAKPNTGLVLYGKDWHAGIIGIVATRITEEFNVPCIIVCDDKSSLKGSGRSVAGFDIVSGLAEIKEHLLSYGGHKQAAGVRITPGRLEDFRQAFQKMTQEHLVGAPVKEPLFLDAVITFAEASNLVHLKELALMEPFGAGNPEPIFASPIVEIMSVKKMQYSKHQGFPESVMLFLRDCTDMHTVMLAKAWGMAKDFPASSVGKKIRIAFSIRLEDRFGLPSPTLTLKDWAEADKELLEADDTESEFEGTEPEASESIDE